MEAEGGALKVGSVPPEKGAKYNSRCRPEPLIRAGGAVEPGPGSLGLALWAYSHRRVRKGRQTMS